MVELLLSPSQKYSSFIYKMPLILHIEKKVKEYRNYDKLPLNHTSPPHPGTEDSCSLTPA